MAMSPPTTDWRPIGSLPEWLRIADDDAVYEAAELRDGKLMWTYVISAREALPIFGFRTRGATHWRPTAIVRDRSTGA